MPSLEETLANAASEAGALNDAVRSFYDDQEPRINTKLGEVDAKINELDAWREGLHEDIPFINLCADGGRFGTELTGIAAGDFAAPGFLDAYNGASAFRDAGRFIHNNADNGGTANALPEAVASLFDDLGDGHRFGIEYYVAEFTQGTGTLNPGEDGTFLSMVSNGRPLPPKVSLSYFVRASSGSFSTIPEARINGEDYDGSAITDGKWRHVFLQQTLPLGFGASLPQLYASPGAVVQLACFSILPGHAVFLDHNHKHPIPGVDSVWR